MRILFTGGGTAGHVTPNYALIQRCLDAGWDVHYAGSHHGIERELIEQLATRQPLTYHGLASGKLRRYLSWQNLLDVFRVLLGIVQGWLLCRRLRPDVVFSKGGFVSVPPVVGAWLCGIPVVAHESDLTAGLATRLVAPLVRCVCVSFPDTRVARARRVVATGTPLRDGLLDGDAQRGRAFAGLADAADSGVARPVLLVVGGSLGSQRLNALVRGALQPLLERVSIVHVCGRGNVDEAAERDGYAQFEFVGEPYADLLALADVAISRAGANGLFELLAARVPTLLVPLTTAGSRGDQIDNARWAQAHQWAHLALEEHLNEAALVTALDALLVDAAALRERLGQRPLPDAAGAIMAEIYAVLPASDAAV